MMHLRPDGGHGVIQGRYDYSARRKERHSRGPELTVEAEQEVVEAETEACSEAWPDEESPLEGVNLNDLLEILLIS